MSNAREAQKNILHEVLMREGRGHAEGLPREFIAVAPGKFSLESVKGIIERKLDEDLGAGAGSRGRQRPDAVSYVMSKQRQFVEKLVSVAVDRARSRSARRKRPRPEANDPAAPAPAQCIDDPDARLLATHRLLDRSDPKRMRTEPLQRIEAAVSKEVDSMRPSSNQFALETLASAKSPDEWMQQFAVMIARTSAPQQRPQGHPSMPPMAMPDQVAETSRRRKEQTMFLVKPPNPESVEQGRVGWLFEADTAEADSLGQLRTEQRFWQRLHAEQWLTWCEHGRQRAEEIDKLVQVIVKQRIPHLQQQCADVAKQSGKNGTVANVELYPHFPTLLQGNAQDFFFYWAWKMGELPNKELVRSRLPRGEAPEGRQEDASMMVMLSDLRSGLLMQRSVPGSAGLARRISALGSPLEASFREMGEPTREEAADMQFRKSRLACFFSATGKVFNQLKDDFTVRPELVGVLRETRQQQGPPRPAMQATPIVPASGGGAPRGLPAGMHTVTPQQIRWFQQQHPQLQHARIMAAAQQRPRATQPSPRGQQQGE